MVNIVADPQRQQRNQADTLLLSLSCLSQNSVLRDLHSFSETFSESQAKNSSLKHDVGTELELSRRDGVALVGNDVTTTCRCLRTG